MKGQPCKDGVRDASCLRLWSPLCHIIFALNYRTKLAVEEGLRGGEQNKSMTMLFSQRWGFYFGCVCSRRRSTSCKDRYSDFMCLLWLLLALLCCLCWVRRRRRRCGSVVSSNVTSITKGRQLCSDVCFSPQAWKRDHVLPLLQSLHWLSIRSRIDYKTVNSMSQLLFSHASPGYISELLTKTYTLSIEINRTFTEQNTQEVKNEHFLISTRQNNVRIFGIRCLSQRDKQI